MSSYDDFIYEMWEIPTTKTTFDVFQGMKSIINVFVL